MNKTELRDYIVSMIHTFSINNEVVYHNVQNGHNPDPKLVEYYHGRQSIVDEIEKYLRLKLENLENDK